MGERASAPGQGAGVQGRGESPRTRDVRKLTRLGGQAGERFPSVRGKGRRQPAFENKTLIPTPTHVTRGAREADLRRQRVVWGQQIRAQTAHGAGLEPREKQVYEP